MVCSMRDRLSVRWPLPGLTSVRERLLDAYADPDRHYHDLLHLDEVLSRIDELVAAEELSPRQVPAVRLAAWFHDAVYDRRPGAEDRSARWAAEALAGQFGDSPGSGMGLAEEVARLVRLTEHHRPEADDLAGAVLSDADLAILAAGPQRYAEYARAVRAEYAEYDDETFARGRIGVLDQLTAVEHIFATRHGRSRWERAARDNIDAERHRLADFLDHIDSGSQP